MNRIDQCFKNLFSHGKKALITFITAGDKDLDMTYDLVIAMEQSGADIIELGIPYSDPLADGPTIQKASIRALSNKIKIKDIMNTVAYLRKETQIPLLFLVYYNSVFKYGIERFINDAAVSGIDALIIPDLPLEERGEVHGIMKKRDMYLIPLVAPTSHERIGKITKDSGGFVYCVSTTGVTGSRKSFDKNIKDYMDEVRSYTGLPLCLGFGISNPTMASDAKKLCDGVIVGSAIVNLIEKSDSVDKAKKNVSEFVKSLKEVL